jgi:hypothetical protein
MTKQELAVLKYAGHWWRNRRPIGWSEEQHMRNHEVNTAGPVEKALARSYARLVRSRKHAASPSGNLKTREGR